MDLKLYEAVREENVDHFKKLVDENPHLLLQVTHQLENTVLHLAAGVGHEGLVKEACEKCESLLAMTNSKGDTALHVAARAGNLSIVTLLVEKSFSGSTSKDVEGGNQTNNILRIQNQGKNTVLHEALRYRHADVVKELTDWDTELWCVVNEVGESPLYLAVKGGLTEIAREVMGSSKPYAHCGPNSLTALHAAVIWGVDDGIVELLVEKKRELIKEKDIYGRTALHYAASKDSFWMCAVSRLLLTTDSSVAYIQDKDGRSPLHFAAGNGNDWTTYMILQRYPDAVDLVDNRGQNAIHVCIANYNQDRPWRNEIVLNFFSSEVTHDELINQPDNDGNTPLHLAVNCGSPDLVRFLLKMYEGRLHTDVMNKRHSTPLDLALPREHPQSLPPKEEIKVFEELHKAGAKFGIAEPLAKERSQLMDAKRILDEYMSRTKEMNNTQMLVATLIATVTFAAAFQVPGGYKSDGTPTLAREAAFQAFVVSDAIALSFSMTAVFLNLIIPLLDDHWPLKVVRSVAILTLIAIVAMLIAFVTGLYVVLTNFLWLPIFSCFIVLGTLFCFLIFCLVCLKLADPLFDASVSQKKKPDMRF